MANGSVNDWDEGTPIISNPRRQGAGEIQFLRQSVRGRVNKEHAPLITGDITLGLGGGEHLPGSAMVYYQTDAPTLRPDGLTSLDTDDAGRVWIKDTDGTFHWWDGTQWIAATTAAQSFDLPGGPLSGETWTYGGTAFPLSAPFSTPITIHSLQPGKWLLFVMGTFDGSQTGTLSVTINTVTRSYLSGSTVDGQVPFMLVFRVVVTGSPTGAISITAVSSASIKINRLEAISGMFLG